MMEKVKFKRGLKSALPQILDDDTIYVTFPNESDDVQYGSINIGSYEWASKDYVDNKIGEIEKLLEEL